MEIKEYAQQKAYELITEMKRIDDELEIYPHSTHYEATYNKSVFVYVDEIRLNEFMVRAFISKSIYPLDCGVVKYG